MAMSTFLFIALLACFSLCDSFQFKRFQVPRSTSSYSTIENKYEAETENVLKISDLALKQLKASYQSGQYLRIGVKSGGCSGMSYTMDYIDIDKLNESDHIEMIGDLKTVIDPKSLLYIYGLELDYSSEMIGGGFKFVNPNAKSSCGCGKSFGV